MMRPKEDLFLEKGSGIRIEFREWEDRLIKNHISGDINASSRWL